MKLLRASVAAIVLATTTGQAQAEQEDDVRWNDAWPRVRLLEVANIVFLTAASVVVYQSPTADRARWSQPILFDKAARSLLKGHSAAAQRLAGDWSDYLYHGMIFGPYLIDNYITALGVHENADVALQMSLMDSQSLGLSGVMSLAAEHWTGRSRPYVPECENLPNGSPDTVGFNHCGSNGDYQSFFSGHAATTFTMAGLTCAHHQHLPLYGGGLPDVLACVGMLGLASTASVFRIVVDRHWASDVMVGVAVGVINGYVLPVWLHYGFARPARQFLMMRTPGLAVAPLPLIFPSGAGVGAAGAF